jgi:RNA polymerase sigma-70 factor, ECF subfamily
MDTNALSDAELVRQALVGDREAFGRLYDRHARQVRAVVAAASGDWPSVEDMTQECFLRAYRKLATLRDPEHVGPWLAGFARQVARERRRTLRRDRHEFSPAITDSTAIANETCTTENQDQIERILRRLSEIPEHERRAIHAFYFAEQNATDAAAQLDVSRSGFYVLLQRALAHLALRPESMTPLSKTKSP